jgi:hypothetical protein
MEIAQGAFRASARWIASPFASHAPERAIAPGRSIAGINGHGEDPRDGGDELGALLDAIADEVHRHAAAARNGVMSDFAAHMAHARKHLSPHLLAAALATYKEQRKAALAAISRNAASEIAARKKAAVMASQPNRGGSGRKQPGDPLASGPRLH